MSDSQTDRIALIRKSLVIFISGVLSFLPIIGLIPAIYAIVNWRRVTVRYGNEWNPASAYLSWGARLAAFSLLVLLLALIILGFAIVSEQFPNN
ncbi:MAG: hypothetical protein QOJ40_2414 [Verrucomicrobiota bacterium]